MVMSGWSACPIAFRLSGFIRPAGASPDLASPDESATLTVCDSPFATVIGRWFMNERLTGS
jgi:hypothetical protein